MKIHRFFFAYLFLFLSSIPLILKAENSTDLAGLTSISVGVAYYEEGCVFPRRSQGGLDSAPGFPKFKEYDAVFEPVLFSVKSVENHTGRLRFTFSGEMQDGKCVVRSTAKLDLVGKVYPRRTVYERTKIIDENPLEEKHFIEFFENSANGIAKEISVAKAGFAHIQTYDEAIELKTKPELVSRTGAWKIYQDGERCYAESYAVGDPEARIYLIQSEFRGLSYFGIANRKIPSRHNLFFGSQMNLVFDDGSAIEGIAGVVFQAQSSFPPLMPALVVIDDQLKKLGEQETVSVGGTSSAAETLATLAMLRGVQMIASAGIEVKKAEFWKNIARRNSINIKLSIPDKDDFRIDILDRNFSLAGSAKAIREISVCAITLSTR